jgi:hypothetical protein
MEFDTNQATAFPFLLLLLNYSVWWLLANWEERVKWLLILVAVKHDCETQVHPTE